MRSSHLKKAKELWMAHVGPDDIVVDATCGNGHDTLFLSQLAKHVYALDIQEKAIENTRARLEAHWRDQWKEKATLYLRSHEEFSWLAAPPRLIVYNLGYLPSGDKSLTTMTRTTLVSLENARKVLAPDGAICVMCYPGHAEGEKEEKAILQLGGQHYTWGREKAPSLVWFCA